MSGPLDAARARLAAALIAGEDSAPHRAAIARLEAGARAAEERRAADAMATEEQRVAAIQGRAAGLAAETLSRVDALLAQHPVPAAADAGPPFRSYQKDDQSSRNRARRPRAGLR